MRAKATSRSLLCASSMFRFGSLTVPKHPLSKPHLLSRQHTAGSMLFCSRCLLCISTRSLITVIRGHSRHHGHIFSLKAVVGHNGEPDAIESRPTLAAWCGAIVPQGRSCAEPSCEKETNTDLMWCENKYHKEKIKSLCWEMDVKS